MSRANISNHLRAFRKRLALSQTEVAQLLGSPNSAKICRYESFAREPRLHTILGYEAIFDVPARELFRSLYNQIERKIAARAKALLSAADSKGLGHRTERTRHTLSHLANRGRDTQGKTS